MPPLGATPTGNFVGSDSTTAPFMTGAVVNRSCYFAFYASFEV